MSRGQLDEESLTWIGDQLPDFEPIWQFVNHLSPELISMSFPRDSSVPAASVCYQDAVHTLSEARFAMHEYHAHRIWYRQRREPPKVVEATYFEKYFLDDVALRLYATAEHLASAIINTLGITAGELKPHRAGRSSKQVIVGKYLRARRGEHPMSRAVLRLAASDDWMSAMDYRGDWVHKQPPTVKGLGIVFRRGPRWKANVLEVGGGDEPHITITALFGFMDPAFQLLSSVLGDCLDTYKAILQHAGIEFQE